MGMQALFTACPHGLFTAVEPHIHKLHVGGQSFQDPVTSLAPSVVNQACQHAPLRTFRV